MCPPFSQTCFRQSSLGDFASDHLIQGVPKKLPRLEISLLLLNVRDELTMNDGSVLMLPLPK